MANEITIVLSMRASKGGASIDTVGSTGAASANYDMTGTDMLSATQILATSGTTYALNLGSVTPPYRAYVMNMGPGVVQLDRATAVSGTPAQELAVGDECLLVVPAATTYYAKADATNTSIFAAIVEK